MTAEEISWPTRTPPWAEDSRIHWSNVTVNAQLCFSTHMERFGSDWRWFSPWRRRLSTLPEPETTGGRAPLHKKEKTQSFRVKALTSKLNILEEPVKTYKRPIKDLYKTYSRPLRRGWCFHTTHFPVQDIYRNSTANMKKWTSVYSRFHLKHVNGYKEKEKELFLVSSASSDN